MEKLSMDNRSELIDKLVRQWLKIAERDLMTAWPRALKQKLLSLTLYVSIVNRQLRNI